MKLKHIIDTWNMIEKYDIKGWKDEGNYIEIPEAEYNKLLGMVKNQKYIKNLVY